MRRTQQPLLAVALLLGGLSLAGCKQSAGEYCEVNTDCEEGLICNARGFCAATNVPDDAGIAPAPEAGAAVDTAAPPLGDAGAGAEVAVTSDGPLSPDLAAADASPDVTPDLAPDTAPAALDGSSN